ncbi:hypothetical protein PCANC_12874 [Puccinia coronata f. sp. avenae]|uniref:t-SNARE coiled-coil homology domain-containing protein n=1 Tax=Puccinia coronata f. sp. avenae TaxID=200324 RepID=A0A2N5SS86_9BASI|nr:hypothetical protein PCANC_17478 [Puccinia coronata f. sp. avenae]PLW35001.1 hypothetical protein PCASD_15327 [Puccinia coronata f. sp. avenae]PLW48297.1 hypothetical protein PCANC_12874 [Puccinia coronata f. sp. avenae]
MSKLTHRDPNRAALLSRGDGSSSSPYTQGSSQMPSYGRGYHTDAQHPFPSSSSSSFSNHRTAEELESQNDEAIEGLSAKVRLLKEITVNIGTEVKDSTNLMATLTDTFSEATGALSGTFRKMDRMAKKQYGRWWYWFLFLVLVFWIFFFTWLWRR